MAVYYLISDVYTGKIRNNWDISIVVQNI